MAVFTALTYAVAAYSGGASLFSAAGVWLASAGVAGQLLVSLGANALLGALSPKPAAAAQRGYETNVLGAGLDHTVIYGKTKVGGVVVYNEATGTANKFLHRIIAVAGHEVESFDRIYIDDAYIDFGDLDASGNVPSVVDPDGSTSDRYNNNLRIQVAYGTPTQAANADLVSESDSLWTASHKLSGIAYIYVRLAFDADVYPNGIPTFTAVVKGKKVYDPRTDTTAWSDNPALCVRDYLTSTGYGLGEVADNIDDDLVKDAADICDQTVFSTTRYTTNGAFTTGAAPYDLISSILPSMGGSLWYAQGKWRMKPAYWTTPVMFLDEDDLRSSISVSTRHSRRDNFNVIKGKFSGPDTNWQQADYKEVRNETSAGSFVTGLPYSISEVGTTDFTAIGADSNTVGEVFTATGAGTGSGVADLNLGVDNGLTSVADVDLLFTDTMKEARRLGRITLERNRQQLTISASFGLKTLGLQVGDNVYITNSRFGWTNKAFEVLSWNFGLTDELDLQTQMTLRETAEEVFDEFDDAAIYEADNTNLPSPFFVPVPSLDAAVVTTTINEDGTAVPAIDFSWGVSNSEVVDYYDFQWKLSTDTNYSSTVVEEPRFRIAPALSNVAYDYRVRAVNTLGIKSNYASSVSPASTGNDLTIPNPPTSLVAEGGYSTVKLTWTPPTTNTDASTIRDLFQYQIFRGTSTNPTTFVGRVSGESFTDGGLDDDTTYYYRVKAQDFTGNLSSYSTNVSVTTDVAPAGARGAGRWNIGVSSLPTTSSGANTDFVAAIGQPVDKDQAWFYTGTAANPTSQGVWLYDAGTPVWIEQDEVVDGNLLVAGTVTANAIDADAITGKNVTVGDLTATTVPTGSQKGARIQSDGTMLVGNREEYLRWDGSLLTVTGEIRNIDPRIFDGRSGYWERITSTGSVTAAMNRLGGAGLFVFIMCGGGGSGARGNTTTRSQTGGGAGGFARAAYEWDGSTAISFAAGAGGAAHSGSTEVDGFDGSSSVLTVGGSTAITCTGGGKGLTWDNGGAGGAGGTGTINNASIFTNTRTSTGGAGGSTTDDYRQSTGGGGINVFGISSNNNGGNFLATGTGAANATGGGGPFGSPANDSRVAITYTGFLDAGGFLSLAPTTTDFVELRTSIPFTPSDGAYSGTGSVASFDSGEFSGSGGATGGTTDDSGSSGDAGYGGGSGAAHSDGGQNAGVGSGGNGVLYIGRV